MPLSDNQLLMLDNLIYTDYVKNGDSVETIIGRMENDLNNGKSIDSCMMKSDEWRELINNIKKQPDLLSYSVQNYKNDSNTGMRAACFVDDPANSKDVNVVFRGTSGDYEWHDNGQGGYLSDTKQQEEAAKYINQLPKNYGNNMTVTGHSKGGNKAQYVTIVTDRIGKCVSFDGQGFSKEFLDKYTDEISQKSNKITSICASEDYVNSLLFPIAGTRIYLESDKEKVSQFIEFHKPNILFDKNGEFNNQTEQSELSKLINEYTTYMISTLEEPERSATVDGLIALLESGEDKESILQTILAANTALSHADDFAFDYIADNYGVGSELLLSYLAALYCPALFFDDFLEAGKDVAEHVYNKMIDFSNGIINRLKKLGKNAEIFANIFLQSIQKLGKKVLNLYNKLFNIRNFYTNQSPYVQVDPSSLRQYASRLQKVNSRLVGLDRRLDALYWQVGLKDILTLLHADALTGYSWKLTRCVSYLNDTASDFENTERTISSKL